MAVGKFSALNEELHENSAGEASLDDVVRELTRAGTAVDLNRLTEVAESLVGDKLDTLHINNLPGCRNIASGNQET